MLVPVDLRQLIGTAFEATMELYSNDTAKDFRDMYLNEIRAKASCEHTTAKNLMWASAYGADATQLQTIYFQGEKKYLLIETGTGIFSRNTEPPEHEIKFVGTKVKVF